MGVCRQKPLDVARRRGILLCRDISEVPARAHEGRDFEAAYQSCEETCRKHRLTRIRTRGSTSTR